MYMSISINKSLLIAALCCCLLIACAAGRHTPVRQVPAYVIELLGDSTAQLLSCPDQVTFYALQNEAGGAEIFPGYYRRDEGKKLSFDEIAVFRFLVIENPVNYKPMEFVMSAPFLPFAEFEFQKGKTRLSILVSTSDRSWALVQDKVRMKVFTFCDADAVERLIGQLENK